jgi:hypothetical protein
MFGVAVLILTLSTAAILAVLISPANPLSWLINHINGTDQQYSQFLIDKGVR